MNDEPTFYIIPAPDYEASRPGRGSLACLGPGISDCWSGRTWEKKHLLTSPGPGRKTKQNDTH